MSFLEVPEGTVCRKCEERPATMVWACCVQCANHGMKTYWCEHCAVAEQLRYARERRDAIPELEAREAELAR